MRLQLTEEQLKDLLAQRKAGMPQTQIIKSLETTYSTLKKCYPQLLLNSNTCKVCGIEIGTANERGYRSRLCLAHKKEDQIKRGQKWRSAHPEYTNKWKERYASDPEFKKLCQERAKTYYQKKKSLANA